MDFKLLQISSMHKPQKADYKEISNECVLLGERFSYILCAASEQNFYADIKVLSPLKEYIKLYVIENAVMDMPTTMKVEETEGYISKEPGLMPDILVPIEEYRGKWSVANSSELVSSLYIEVNIPLNIEPGDYDITIEISSADNQQINECKTLHLHVADAELAKQTLIYTRWFYADCVADIHHVPVFSEKHWSLMKKYISAAKKTGVNMIYVPIHTEPLDTAFGITRTCVQLVDIEKCGETYKFGFEKFRKFIDMCLGCGIEYFEMAHLFTQGGAECAPNIMVTENGKTDYMFSWHTSYSSPQYTHFLRQYIKALTNELYSLGIADKTYFHISDEPRADDVERYEFAYNLIKPLIGDIKTFDALSDYVFYEKGLVECPVTQEEFLDDFLNHDVQNQWVYYCCFPQKTFPNALLAMTLSRVRILGILLYKFNIQGFLHWGLNYYNSWKSYHLINPYITTSADKAYPSGDPFILYPGNDTVYSSLRGESTFDAIQDMRICQTLQNLIGRDKVIKLIDEEAGFSIHFDKYPTDDEFLPRLRRKLITKIEESL